MNPNRQGKSFHGRTRVYRGRKPTATGVVGVTFVRTHTMVGHVHRYFFVTPHQRRFNIDSLGWTEAFRRAVELRAEHEQLAATAQKGAA